MILASEIRAGGIYETGRRQARKVLRVSDKHVLYQIIDNGRPTYVMTVSRGKFASDAVRLCEANRPEDFKMTSEGRRHEKWRRESCEGISVRR